MSSESYLGQHINVTIEESLDFSTAKDVAQKKVKEISSDAMLLSWYRGETGEHYPTLKCGHSEKPAWFLYAEARGGDITIDINKGEFIFVFLSLS